MTLQTYHVAALNEVEELGFEFLVLLVHYEAYAHPRTRTCLNSAFEELVAVDFVIEFGRLDDGATLHFLDAAFVLNPFEGLHCCKNRHYRRSIEHRIAVDVGLVVEHCGDGAVNLAEEFVFYDNECYTSAREVFLCATVDKAVLADVHRTAEDVGACVGYHGNRRIEVFQDFSTEDGVVGGDVHVVAVRGDCEALGDVGVVVGFARYFYNIAEEFGLFFSLVSPRAGIEVESLVAKEVHRNHCKLEACAAAKENHRVSGWNVKHLLEEFHGLVHHCVKRLVPVRHAHERDACAVEVFECFCSLLHGVVGKDRRSCEEIMLCHFSVLCNCFLTLFINTKACYTAA